MTDHYAFWRDSLAGLSPKMYVDDPKLGFYRKALKQRNAKGNNKRVGWVPVAIFMDRNVMTARVGEQDVFGDALNELWSYVAGNPISEELYRDITEKGGSWPDFPQSDIVPASNREVSAGDNAAPEQPLDVQHATAVDNAIAAALKKVTNETEAAQALGSKNRIAELRLAADKAGKAIYDPIYRAYTAEQKKWSPIVKRAEYAEKDLNTAILTFRESERKRIAAEQAAAEAKQREIDEANARMADRAIARGEPEPEPVIEDVPMPAIPAPVVATYGTRKLKEEVKTFLESVNDFDAVYTYFKDTAEVKALLTTLATAAIRAGRTVPGTTTREGLI